ncbi:CaiB/BaiF CoA-transferase family protein [Desulfosporosinus sp. BICA1-9]|uniref:CaiB/BaiF CoA transferase family protein n=1 Tax=Desulfosporosinus sp. BICA1-9 TaxID=1531958 RepID=UPI00054C65D0|nr:CoA transferase [Desulfosporosinus sp. BICA1-9]KJS48105.1 MAG: succinyl-CoA:benzylsuccinate CoA-transferase [Peptococcaceae bacterium BRH_c23]KJS89504.1 MAG: succinyl-CoA:benzylsuccinate CoA-transferase [Desulfosporosinus sp. BICA1-9]HBV86305.1 CoA transferase [Desulfosporosinus sp.]
MPNKRPLEGVRVCDFSWVGAGPSTTRLLSEYGADVIRLESKSRLDLLRLIGPYKDGIAGIERSGYFSNRNPNKRSIDINMKNPQARDLVVKLIKESDIVINNFTMGVMEKWNLGYEEVNEIKPDIIYVTMPTQGSTGPHKNYMGFGITMNALVGIHYLTGYPDKVPFGMGTNYPDHVPNPVHTAFAIAVALLHRRKTGQGQLIDVSQTEAALAVLPTSVMNYAANGKVLERRGNRDLNVAPHGVYATKGDRRWIAIAVFNQSEWAALLNVMGNSEWSNSEKFSSAASRLENQDELDEMIETWTNQHEAYQLMDRLAQAGVRAGVLQNSKDLLEDPQLNERGFWAYLNHQEMRRHVYNVSPAHLSKTPAQLYSPAPLLGEHTDRVLKEVLGLSEAEIVKLREEKVIG